ncbi:MAG: glycerol-3-phosphate cytidylyltransferase, partial [Thiobacillus sp.]
ELAEGGRLIVGLSTDEFNEIKGKKPFHSYEERKCFVEAIRYVDIVIPETCWEQKTRDIKDFGVDIFVMGSDWKGKFDELKDLCEVVYLERTPDISTTELKKIVKVK